MSRDSRQAVEEVLRCIREGNMERGLSLCRSRLDDAPNDVNLTALLGAVLIKAGNLDDAERYLRRAIELEPGFAKPHEDLGMLCLARGDNEQAILLLEKAITVGGPQASTLKALAAAFRQAGRTRDTELLYARYPQLMSRVSPLVQADLLRKAGDLPAAEKLCQTLLQQEPENVAAMRMLAVLASETGQFAVAENLLLRVVSLVPESVAAAQELARFLGERGRYPEAIALLEPFSAQDTANSEVQLALGDMLSIVGRSADALNMYDKCLRANPNDTAALLGRAHMLRIKGQSDAAVQTYRQCASVRPDLGNAWWSLATMRGYEASDEDIASILRLLDSHEDAQGQEVAAHFALARAFENRRNFDRAWHHYTKGNSARRAAIKYDPVEIEIQNRAIREVFDTALLSAKEATTPGDVTPIFVVGMPRSGSTLVEQILASHSRVAGCGELPHIGKLAMTAAASRTDGLCYPGLMRELSGIDLTGLGRSYLHYATAHTVGSKLFFTDKMPSNFLHAGFIHQILPHAKIINAHRDPIATCVANYRQLFAAGKNQTYNLNELGKYYLQYVEMMNHWDRVMPGIVFHVRYEDVVADVESQVRRILDYCELPYEASCIDFHKNERPVNTASSEQVRQPLYDSAVEFWKHYDPYLDELREVLAPIL